MSTGLSVCTDCTAGKLAGSLRKSINTRKTLDDDYRTASLHEQQPSEFTQFDRLDRWTPVVNPDTSNIKDWSQIGISMYVRGTSHVEQLGGYPEWGDAGTNSVMQVYTESFNACTDCAAGKYSAFQPVGQFFARVA